MSLFNRIVVKNCPEKMIAVCTCGYSADADTFETELDQDGWESEPYTVLICPKATNNCCVDDFIYEENK